MYSTCLFCHHDLGTNEVIEHFPVGRRLSFDAAKGRLWVVCRKCERWNLTPLEERWEAIEECERLFTSTRLRVSTDNIGLAKLREGLELVRIGQALRPEMAAWRYGDQFGRRRRKHLLLSGAAIAAVGGFLVLGPATGIIAGGGWGGWQVINSLHSAYQNRRVRARLRLPDRDQVVPVRKKQLERVTITRSDDDWALWVPLDSRTKFTGEDRVSDRGGGARKMALYTGTDALRAAAKLLPAINESGARAHEVRSAVDLVTTAGDPMRLFQRYAPAARTFGRASTEAVRASITEASGHVIANLPKEVRVALEMASHEEQERRALEGELALLEAAWREAEEVAGIADDMFVPESATIRLQELKREG
jgi:hypothetical protein